MRRVSIEAIVLRGGVVALLAAGAATMLPAQAASPTRAPKDTMVLKIFSGQAGDSVRVTRIPLDSIRELFRAWEAEPLASLQSLRMAKELEAMLAMTRPPGFGGVGTRIIFAGPEGARLIDKGWLGLTTGGMHDEWSADGHFLRYFDHPPIVAVTRRSPAQVAGIAAGDTLIAYDGVDVVQQPINLTQLLTPDRKVAVTVRRDGETKAFTVVVGRQPNEVFARRILPGEGPMTIGPDLPGDGPGRAMGGVGRIQVRGAGDESGRITVTKTPNGIFFSMVNGVFGARLSPMGAELAKKWKTETGVLVNEVPDDTPASRAGLKAGDVIVRVSGEQVSSVEDVRTLAALRGESHTVTLQILRDNKPLTITMK